MATSSKSEDRKTLRRLLKKINRTWSRGRVEDLGEHFHKDMVIVGLGFQARAEGRQASIQSYRDFRDRASVQTFRESDVVIDLWGSTAVVTYRWEITYEMDGQDYEESGREILVFLRTRGRWQAVWRTILVGETA